MAFSQSPTSSKGKANTSSSSRKDKSSLASRLGSFFSTPPPLYPNQEDTPIEPIPNLNLLDRKQWNIDTRNFLNWELPCSRVEEGRKNIENFKMILLERARVEEEYAAGLKSIAANPLLFAVFESPGVQLVFNGTKHTVASRAEQSAAFARAIRVDVIEKTINPMLNYYQHTYKKIKKEGMELQKELEKVFHNFFEALRRVAHASQIAEEAAFIAQRSAHYAPSYRTNVAISALQKCFVAFEEDEKYLQQTKLFKEYVEPLRLSLNHCLEALLDIDRQRICGLKDAACKLTVHETSLLRNNQYDLSHYSENSFKLEAAAELNHFLNKHDVFNRVLAPQIDVVSWVELVPLVGAAGNREETSGTGGSTATSMAKTMLQNIFLKQNNRGNSFPSNLQASLELDYASSSSASAIIERLSASYNDYLEKIWTDQIEEASAELCTFSDCLSNSLQRYVLCGCLAKRCATSTFLKSSAALSLLTNTCVSILDIAQSQQDVWSARTIMMISKRVSLALSREDDESDKSESRGRPVQTLHHALYAHPYWNKQTYWEEALIISISECLQHDMLMVRWKAIGHENFVKEEKVFRQENPSFGILYSFGDYMTSFGISASSAKALVTQVCQRLHLTEEFVKNLMKIVIDTSSAATEVSHRDTESAVSDMNSTGKSDSDVQSVKDKSGELFEDLRPHKEVMPCPSADTLHEEDKAVFESEDVLQDKEMPTE